jgi:hypothetical protein
VFIAAPRDDLIGPGEITISIHIPTRGATANAAARADQAPRRAIDFQAALEGTVDYWCYFALTPKCVGEG